MSGSPSNFAARVRTVLVFGVEPSAFAVPATIVAWADPASPHPGRKTTRMVQFVGPGQVDNRLVRHTNRTIVPLVNRLLQLLGIPPHQFRISVVSVSIASLQDVDTRVAGFSMDLALFVAMLAAALHVQARPDAMLTGHIASKVGDIRMVRSLAQKRIAAMSDPEITYFVCPQIDPGTAKAMPDAVDGGAPAPAAARPLRTVPVADISQLLPLLFMATELVRASLHHDYLERQLEIADDGSPLSRAAAFLIQDNEARFWATLSEALQGADNDVIVLLLEAYVDYWIRHGRFPHAIGNHLRQLVLAVPPWKRKRELRFPYLPLQVCCRLAGLAKGLDERDAVDFIDAVQGRLSGHDEVGATAQAASSDADALVRRTLESISAESLAAKYAKPLNAARAKLTLDRNEVTSHGEFHEVIESSYRFLIIDSQLMFLPADDAIVANEAFRLLRDAYAEEGGVQAAEAEARTATHGGLRRVIDRMTDRLVAELTYNHIDRALKELVDSRNRKQKLQVVRAILAYLGNQLPADIRRRPASDFVEKRDLLIRGYLQSRDRLVDAFRSI